MSTENKNKEVLGLLSRLNKTLKKPQATQSSNFIDYKALKEEKEKAFTKCKPGLNKFIFLTPEGAEDPFQEWATHAGLLEKPFWTIDCNHHNKGENCLVCNIVKSLKEQDKDNNKAAYKPIDKKVDVYAPVINAESAATMAEGPKWLRITKIAIDQFTVWLENLESDEQPFYSETEPQTILLTYNNGENVAPKDSYKVDRKNAKPFSEEQLAEWKKQIKPLSYYMGSFTRSEDDLKKIIHNYLQKVADTVSDSNESENDAENDDTSSETSSKLDALKKK